MLAENLALLRNLRGMTQEEVAEVIGISRQSYAKWEQGETIPDIEKCDRLAKFYGVAIDALVHQDEEIGRTRVAPAPVRSRASRSSRRRSLRSGCRRPCVQVRNPTNKRRCDHEMSRMWKGNAGGIPLLQQGRRVQLCKRGAGCI